MPVVTATTNGEDKDRQIDLNRRLMRERQLRQVGSDDANRLVREQNAEPGAGKRQQQRFSQQLANDPYPAGADRGSHREFVLSGGGSREKQNRDVGAADQQQQGNRTEQQVERSAKIVHKLFVETDDVKPQFSRRIKVSVFPAQTLRQGAAKRHRLARGLRRA